MSNSIKLILIIAGLAIVFVSGGFVMGRFLSESPTVVADLRTQNESLASQLAATQAELTDLKQRNAKMEADIAGGRTIEEERKALDIRFQEVERREANVATIELELAGREAKVRQSEQEFHEATNLTQQEIGQAKQISTEYEAMRQARDDALNLANKWLMFIYGISIAAGVLLITAIVLMMRYWASVVRYWTETEQRRQVVELMTSTLTSSLRPDQVKAIVSAMSGVAGLPPPEYEGKSD